MTILGAWRYGNDMTSRLLTSGERAIVVEMFGEFDEGRYPLANRLN